MRGNKITDEQVQYILSQYPDSHKDNTEFLLRIWETAAEQRGHEFPGWLQDIIRSYKPESCTRRRREIIESTKGQREEEYQYWKEFRKKYGA